MGDGDEAAIYDGIRSQFPSSFGKQSKSQTPLELIHNATRRTTAATSAAVNSANDKPSASKKTNAFASLSSSSKDWLDSLKNSNPRNSKKNGDEDKLVGPPRPPAGLVEDDDMIVGPPRPPPGSDAGDEDDEPLIGPPRPPPGGNSEDDDDGPMIGPPRPPRGQVDSDSDEDVDEEDEDPGYRIPISNEIVLKGHTKVKLFS